MTAYSQYQQGQAAGKAADFNAEQSKYNAKLADQRAGDAYVRSAVDEAKISDDTVRTLGSGRASFAGAGVDLSSGSVSYWQNDVLQSGATDIKTRQYNAQQEAQGISGEAWSARANSRLEIASGRSSRNAGTLNAGSSLLAGAATTKYKF